VQETSDQLLAAAWLVVAALGIHHWYRRRRRAGRDPLGPRPEGELPDTARALVLGGIPWVFFTMVVLPTTAHALRFDTTESTFAFAAGNLLIAACLVKPATSGTLKPAASRTRLVVAGLLAGVAVAGAAMFISFALQALSVPPPEQEVVAQARAASGMTRIVYGAAAVVMAPVAEEVFFRGIFLPAAARLLSVEAALVVQALAFGMLHMAAWNTWPTAVPLAFVGWCAGRLYLRTGSLGAAVAMHATFNAINLAMLYLLT
jgi:membrane protease YdiL (CAAX protease family)